MNSEHDSLVQIHGLIENEIRVYTKFPDDYNFFCRFAIHSSRIIYYVFIGRFKEFKKRQEEYMKLREHFNCERENFYSLFAQLCTLRTGFGFENSDKVIECLKKSNLTSPGVCFWCIPTGSGVLKGTIEFIIFADKKRREILQLQCDLNEEIVPLKILAIQKKDDIYIFNGQTDRLILLSSYFPNVFTYPIYPDECKYTFEIL